MNTLAELALGSFLVTFSGAASPGPVLTITLAESARRGFRAGPLIVLGHAALEVPVVTLVVMGGANALRNPHILRGISAAGALTLLVLSWMTLKDARRGFVQEEASPLTHWWDLPLKGILTSLSNPYWFIWWATVGFAYLGISMKFGTKGALVFYVAHIGADLAWYSFVSAAVTGARGFIMGRGYRLLLTACSLMLLAFSIYFAAVAVRGV